MKKQTFTYTYELKVNPITKLYSIVRYKWDLKGKMLGKATPYKKLDKTIAEDYKYFLDRGKQPI